MNRLLTRPKAILFDLFGTLVQEFDQAAIARLMDELHQRVSQDPRLPQLASADPGQFALAMAHQYDSRYRAAAAGHCESPNVEHAIADLLMSAAPFMEPTPEAIAAFIEHYAACEQLIPYEETLEVLDTCMAWGLPTGLLSNVFFPGWIYRAQMHSLKLATRLDQMFFSSDMPYMKPHPDIFRIAAVCLGHPPEECLMVGDRMDLDIAGARAAGMPAVLIAHEPPLDAPDLPVIARLQGLLSLIEQAPEYTPSEADSSTSAP